MCNLLESEPELEHGCAKIHVEKFNVTLVTYGHIVGVLKKKKDFPTQKGKGIQGRLGFYQVFLYKGMLRGIREINSIFLKIHKQELNKGTRV